MESRASEVLPLRIAAIAKLLEFRNRTGLKKIHENRCVTFTKLLEVSQTQATQ